MDRKVINAFASELTDDSYKKLYNRMINKERDFSFFKEAADELEEELGVEEEEVAEEVGHENVSVVGKIAVRLIEMIEEKMSQVKTIEIAESKGDVTELKYNDQFEAISTILENLQETQGMESTYAEIYLENYNFLQNNSREFKRAFRDSQKNLLSMFYIALVLYHIEMTTIMSSALLEWVEEGENIDNIIQDRDTYREVFEQVRNMLNDENLPEFMSVDLSENLIAESNISGDFLLMYSETSINDVIKLFKVGLAKFLHKLAGFLRFIVYLFYYGKFSLEQKIQKINNVIELYQTDRKDEREQLMRETREMDREYKVSTVDAKDKADKQFEKEKIDIEDSEGFRL